MACRGLAIVCTGMAETAKKVKECDFEGGGEGLKQMYHFERTLCTCISRTNNF